MTGCFIPKGTLLTEELDTLCCVTAKQVYTAITGLHDTLQENHVIICLTVSVCDTDSTNDAIFSQSHGIWLGL